MSCPRRMLTDAAREEISRGIAEDLDGQVIAARIRPKDPQDRREHEHLKAP